MKAVLLLIALTVVAAGLKSWKDQGYVAQTQDEGQCHANWAFVATSIYESWYLYQNSSQYTNATIDFSEQFILQCSGYGDCSTGSLSDAMSYAVAFGLPNETDFQYAGTATTYGIPNATSSYTCTTIKSKTNKVNRTTYVNKYGNISYSQMRSMLGNFVVGSWVAADGDFYNYTSSNSSTVPYNCSVTVISDYQLNIPVVVVGYDDSSNLILQVAGRSSMGGTVYGNDTQTGAGFVKISSSSTYCGSLRKVSQIWFNSSSNYYNNSGVVLVAANVLLAATLLIY